MALPERLVRAGRVHIKLMGTIWRLLLRSNGWALASSAEWGLVTLSVLGLLVRAAGGYYGGELVYRFRAGVSKKMRPSDFDNGFIKS
jgi:uncharacterized membrane protein